MPRPLALAFAVLALLAGLAPVFAAPRESFGAFLHRFEAQALAAGISRAIYARATAGLTPDPNIPDLVATQPEFATTIWAYMDRRITGARVTRGRQAMRTHAALFTAIGRQYGVDPAILGAIWGIETDYGAVLDNPRYIRPIVRALATLTWQRRGRVEADAAELVAALKLVQRGPLDADHLVGSWAGAIGHLQVNPTTVLKYGTDGDRDGMIDLDHSLADALATSARYLRALGYRPGVDWGYEVTLPAGFDYLLAGREQLRPVSFFAARGVRRVADRHFADMDEPVFLYVPAGQDGPKFLMTRNYLVLKGYNFSDSYALTVAHLADRLKGAGDFVASWPRDTKFPDLEQRKAIQLALIRRGLLSGPADGRIGPLTQKAYARFQAARHEVADGFVTLESYRELVGATH